jgi:hypothetical protein
VVSGGQQNTASAQGASVGGGSANSASQDFTTVSGGTGNQASGAGSFVGGGNGNAASGQNSAVGGGSGNVASGISSVVSGGSSNLANGSSSTVAGGVSNRASGEFSFAAGRRAQAVNTGTFVWSDGSVDADFASTLDNSFLIRAAGGVGINTNSPAATLDVAGSVRMQGFQLGSSASSGQVLTSDGSGVGSWQDLPRSLLTLPYAGTVSYADDAFRAVNTGSGSGVTGVGSSGNGVTGSSQDGVGVSGASATNYGVSGVSGSSYGVYGSSASGEGLHGVSTSGYGVLGISVSGDGLHGDSTSGYGVYGSSNNAGIYGSSNNVGVYGTSSSGDGLYGFSNSGIGVYGSTYNGWAGYFDGGVLVNDNVLVKGEVIVTLDYRFPDGSVQTTAVTGGGGGVPSDYMILGNTTSAPPGYHIFGVPQPSYTVPYTFSVGAVNPGTNRPFPPVTLYIFVKD